MIIFYNSSYYITITLIIIMIIMITTIIIIIILLLLLLLLIIIIIVVIIIIIYYNKKKQNDIKNKTLLNYCCCICHGIASVKSVLSLRWILQVWHRSFTHAAPHTLSHIHTLSWRAEGTLSLLWTDRSSDFLLAIFPNHLWILSRKAARASVLFRLKGKEKKPHHEQHEQLRFPEYGDDRRIRPAQRHYPCYKSWDYSLVQVRNFYVSLTPLRTTAFFLLLILRVEF